MQARPAHAVRDLFARDKSASHEYIGATPVAFLVFLPSFFLHSFIHSLCVHRRQQIQRFDASPTGNAFQSRYTQLRHCVDQFYRCNNIRFRRGDTRLDTARLNATNEIVCLVRLNSTYIIGYILLNRAVSNRYPSVSARSYLTGGYSAPRRRKNRRPRKRG